MKESDKRIGFITDYISAYEEKIKLSNKGGLFDSAKLFELFAIEVGSLYFGQRLNNLNVDICNYPCVDLITADNQTYIQVSTVQDIPAKIKGTLERIRDSEHDDIKNIINLKFFVLNNESTEKVKDYIDKNQIGNIPFTKATDLITTDDILQKAINELEFQIALYDLLKKEVDSIKNNSYKLAEAVENSRSVGLGNIDCKINNEYDIDRSKLIQEIQSKSQKNISIQGNAGSGKSVLCKKLVDDAEILLYARAERFLEETDINKIWGFNVRQTLAYVNDKPIVFFIDSLEFIADARTKLDLLSVLYECTKNYPMTKIITSCRTSDKGAFLKIEGNYSVCCYEVSDLSLAEQLLIAAKYPVIKKMSDMHCYVELLKSPLYINLIITKISSIDNIADENQLREHIWQNVICLNDNKIRTVIESIVFTRAKEFSLGVSSANYDTKIIAKLLSENVLVSNGTTVRLKYDVFEDICFEQYLDNQFNKCKGKYAEFFDEIQSLGRCLYRRYQIWISNKLLAKDNRNKFLYELIFSKNMPPFWKKQTEIGLVKSRHCDQFFIEKEQAIIKNELLEDFIKTTNLYAFEIQNNVFYKFSILQLRPSGDGRRRLIHLIATNKLYEGGNISFFDLEKLCSDYAKMQSKDKQTSNDACCILTYIIEYYISESKTKIFSNLEDILNSLITPVYQLAEHSKEWIKSFWNRITSLYQSGARNQEILAEDIIKHSLEFEHVQLTKYLPKELCNLAEMYWTFSPKSKYGKGDFGFYQREKNNRCYQYGLSEKAEYYEHGSTRNNAKSCNFFSCLFKNNFWIGLNWTIEFVNKAVLNYSKKVDNGLPNYDVFFFDENVKREYLGFSEMWLVTTQEHSMPLVISDLIFCLKEELRNVIENDLVFNNETEQFAYNVKKTIYEKSNNTALLTIIADIGMEFSQKLSGFALDLATNIYIILNDLSRYSLTIKNPVKDMLENQMMMIMNIPFPLQDRYNRKETKTCDLRIYVINSQIRSDEKIKQKCYKILDYLYSIVPNDKENATGYLQIQNMDLRTARLERVDENTLALIPNITGEAKKITKKQEKAILPDNAIASLLKDCGDKIAANEFEITDCIMAIEEMLNVIKNSPIPTMYENILIGLIANALKSDKLEVKLREKFCQIWIDGINKYFINGSFNFEYSASLLLFAQVESDVSNNIKMQIKQLMLDLILYDGQNGVLKNISRFAKNYLSSNNSLAQAIFNTIVKLSEDEMNHQKFNAEYLKKKREKENEESFDFVPNMQPKLFGVDMWIKDANKANKKLSGYSSKKEEILKDYLFNPKALDLLDFDVQNYHIGFLCYAINCGVRLDNESIVNVVKKMIVCMINIWKTNVWHSSHEILDTFALYEVMEFLQRELFESEERAKVVMDILFKDIDFQKFTNDTTKFYLDVFGGLLSDYFDSHNDKTARAKCEKILCLLEENLLKIPEDEVKIELYKSLILSLTTFGGSGDWRNCPSGYSYQDKQFLNGVFSKYGSYHLKNLLNVIYKLHMDKLLPEILLSVRDAFKNAPRENGKWRTKYFFDSIKEEKTIVMRLITIAFMDFNDAIKQDADLTKAFEEILEMLIEINYEEAATILDEFRVH